MADYIRIDVDTYAELLDERFNKAQSWWGNKKTESLWPAYRDLICEVGVDPSHSNPKEVVDNFVVNADIVDINEFTPDGYHAYYYKKYGGLWDELCEDSIIYNNQYALMQV